MAEKFRIPGKCPSCGAPNTSGSNFCLYCGTYFGEPQSSPDEGNQPQDKREGLPSWDTGSGSFEPDIDPVTRSDPEPADVRNKTGYPSRKPEKKISQKIRSWKIVVPFWILLCFLLVSLPALDPKLAATTADSSSREVLFILVFFTRMILFLIQHARKFKPPRWFFWIIVSVWISFLTSFETLLWDAGSSVVGFTFFGTFFVCIIWRIWYPRYYEKAERGLI